ncbi:MAG: hypothetical protein ACI8RD_013133 [Bacillariaceae sp.]|jgi:hypothetical protein
MLKNSSGAFWAAIGTCSNKQKMPGKNERKMLQRIIYCIALHYIADE